MRKKDLFHAIDQCDDKYIAEAAENKKNNKVIRPNFGKKMATAAAVSIVVLGLGVSVAAYANTNFRHWLTETFTGREVTEVDIDQEKQNPTDENQATPEVNVTPDISEDANHHITLADDMEILGEKESFVCKYHMGDEDEVVDSVYSIQDKGLNLMKTSTFSGDYDGTPFSFDYVIINNEILGFNCKGDINSVYHYVDGDTVYASLYDVKDDTVVKGCIVQLNLKTGEVKKLTGDDKICNSTMSPNGKVILLNYRDEGYWTVFDVATGTENKVEGIDGYAHTNEIAFTDDYHILTMGDSYMDGNVELIGTNLIDLQTQQKQDYYKDYGEINIEWSYELKDNSLKVYNITNQDAFTIENVKTEVHPLSVRGDYVLFGDLEETSEHYYLCNLADKTSMEIPAPANFDEAIYMYLAAKEDKLLLTDGKEAYLVDVSKL